MKLVYIFLLSLFIGISSCTEKADNTIVDFATELRQNKELIITNENTFFLTSYIWRDFMPVAEENGSQLMCVVHLIEQDSLDIPNSMDLKKIYIINGNTVWSSEIEGVTMENNYIIRGGVGEGPKWGPNIEVDVVCEFTLEKKVYRILLKSQKIEATY